MSLARQLSSLSPDQLKAGVNLIIGGIGEEAPMIGAHYPALADTMEYIETSMRAAGHDDDTIDNILLGVTLGFAAIAGPTIYQTR